jgi:hypothetical protein
MKNNASFSSPPRDTEALQARFALRVTACLNDLAAQIPADVDERLRFAREQALSRAREQRRSAAAPVLAGMQGNGTAVLGGGGSSWWVRLAAVLPLAVLLGGLLLIAQRNTQVQIDAAAEIDAALLSDDLPPDAYADPGFLEFLKAPQD